MVKEGDEYCPVCGDKLRKYDKVKRILKTKHGLKTEIIIDRVYCKRCKKVHRVIPEEIMPYKHYEKEMILGVQEGFITPYTYGFEDFPSEKQMDRWKREESNLLYENNNVKEDIKL